MIKKTMLSMATIAVVVSLLYGCNGHSSDSQSQRSMPVKVLTVEPSTINIGQEYVGTIRESVSIPLSFATAGTVSAVNVSEGQTVSQGTVLAKLDEKSYKSSYQIALAKERQAQDAYNRLSQIYKKGSLPDVKMVEIESDLQQARSTAQLARNSLSDCVLKAPTHGVIGKRMVEPGMNVLPDVEVLSLLKIEKVNAVVPIPENQIANIQLGEQATVTVAALNNESFTGKITEKGVEADPLSHTYAIKIALSNKEEQLRPGMVCNVVITPQSAQPMITVPQTAIMIDTNNQSYVYVANKDGRTVHKQVIQVGEAVGNGNVAVMAGLSNGDKIVVEGNQKIDDQSLIQIIH
ncbi:efflux RND transporter periplasmic adaptor subunit [Microbacter margulisiae]|uniref:RND family efflux transporter MFP subunit n=1 Tax=Microbacter margulisiae TaxID=1350067 RepID=A0A7W5DPV8_9PORP|nr:efflux RND transporter periplasmic adaptor subunit [Microbacter margulisiae]MBB3186600.1 RND family efflux transporter MFP subunit [Microbacter margulisiae]